MKTENLITSEDKKNWWGDGEWVNESDLVEFDHNGISCIVIRLSIQEPYSKEFHIFGGHLCGYCKIPENHKYHDKSYHDIEIDVHGGVTYADFKDDSFWIGFDCAHSHDIIPSIYLTMEKICEETIKKYPNLKNSPIFGRSYKNIDFCIQECKSMAEQIVNSKENTNE